jgi:hypothetical protein
MVSAASEQVKAVGIIPVLFYPLVVKIQYFMYNHS